MSRKARIEIYSDIAGELLELTEGMLRETRQEIFLADRELRKMRKATDWRKIHEAFDMLNNVHQEALETLLQSYNNVKQAVKLFGPANKRRPSVAEMIVILEDFIDDLKALDDE